MAKYHEIYQELLAGIQQKQYPAGSYLPSENELMAQFSASRDTIRKALNLLQEKGSILKEKGKGSRVLDQSVVTFPMSGITSFKELKSHSSARIETQVLECKTGLIPDGQRHLNLGPDDPVTMVVRSRTFDGERVILDIDFFNAAIVPGITPAIAQDSLYEYIENTLHLPIAFAKKEITVEPVRSKESQELDLHGASLLAVVRSHTYLEDATLFQYTVSKHRTDKFRFLDFARREKI